MTKDNPEDHVRVRIPGLGPHIDQRVTSYGQSGGVTAHTVNMGPQPRHINESLKAASRRQIPRDKPVLVMAVMGDTEACQLAVELHAFLKADGYKMSEPGGISQGLFGGPVKGLGVNDDGDHYTVVVGANLP